MWYVLPTTCHKDDSGSCTVALGREPGDLLLTGGRVLNVFTLRVEPADVAVADGSIAGVGPFEWQALRCDPPRRTHGDPPGLSIPTCTWKARC